MIDREAIENDEIVVYHIPKGSMLLIFIHGLHHSNQYWDSPEQFNPERFDKVNGAKQQPFTYIPFGGGPRICIGSKYAMLQMLIILCRLIERYDISLDSPSKIEIAPMIILKPKGKIYFNFKVN